MEDHRCIPRPIAESEIAKSMSGGSTKPPLISHFVTLKLQSKPSHIHRMASFRASSRRCESRRTSKLLLILPVKHSPQLPVGLNLD